MKQGWTTGSWRRPWITIRRKDGRYTLLYLRELRWIPEESVYYDSEAEAEAIAQILNAMVDK